ncbi:helix-turn-helix domain-containing protein [Rhodopseudomonas palustris]|uniref:helix-turn-helix domain-containing protein n=1 Tax=Rhodopseudomonas palustris TaxID=1076 RepID=UPI002ACD6096|nr:helix-turn-helix domain-containing protein [Rhodopseudomonas palustris]WQH01382.1 helix-turn-helix domain-containing protein [Rhodopseudomonas palustris]
MAITDAMIVPTDDCSSWLETHFDLLGNAAAIRSNRQSFTKGERIYTRNETAHHAYAVLEGAVRASHCLPDGRRHLRAFHLPGEIFGLDGDALRSHETEALVKTTMLAVRLDDLDREAGLDAGLAWGLCNLAAGELRKAREHMVLLGRKSALERVAAFLLEMDRRLATKGVMSLPMCEHDMADYLGLSNETVSRCLTKLQALRIIVLSKRRTVRFLDRAGLHEFDAS